MKARSYGFIMLLLLAVFSAHADEDLDVTMTIIEDENISEEQFVNEIRLPIHAAEQAHENASHGMETSNQARQQGREFGAQRAQEARENNGAAASGNPTNSGPPSSRPETPASR